MRERIRMIRSLEAELRPADRHPGRPAGAEAARRHLRGRSGRPAQGREPSCSTAIRAPGDVDRVHLPHPEILRALRPGHTVLIDDGKVKLHITEATETRAVATVDVAGKISNKKGVSLPDTEIATSAMTAKDRSDLDAALNEGVDWIAVSFVQRADDVAEVKKIARGPRLRAGQDREAAGHHQARRDRGDLGCAHGGARRPRGRDAAREGAGPAEAHHPALPAATASPWWWRPRCSNR